MHLDRKSRWACVTCFSRVDMLMTMYCDTNRRVEGEGHAMGSLRIMTARCMHAGWCCCWSGGGTFKSGGAKSAAWQEGHQEPASQRCS